MKIIFYLFLVFALLEMAQALDQEWSKALALAQKDDKKKKGKDKKGKKPKKGGKKPKKGGKGDGGDDGGGDDGDDAGGDDDDGDGDDDDDQLSYEALNQMVKDFSEQVMSLKTESSQNIVDRLREIEDENIEFIEQIRDWFNEENKIVQEKSIETIKKLRNIVLKNQLTMFAFTQTLLDKKKDDHEHLITQYKQQIQEMMKKFPPPKSSCDLIQDCESCLQRRNCIWCSESESCREGNAIDGAYFWSCPYILSQTCETPKSDHFFRLPPLRESHGKFFDFSTDPNMPLEQKQFLMRKQTEILSVKQQIEKKRLQLTQMQNITIMIRAKHIQLSFYIKQLEQERDSSIEDAEMDADYEEYFLDVIDADDVKEAVEQLEDNVMQMRAEDVEADQEQLEQEKQEQEDLLEARRNMYEGQASSNSKGNDKPIAKAKKKKESPTLSGNSKESLEDMLNNQKKMEQEKKKNKFFW